MACVGLYARLDPEGGPARLGTEQEFWKEVPEVFAALEQAPIIDMCLPKPGGEVLVAGFCRAPGDSFVSAQEVAFRVGNVERRIAVFGDRERLPGGGVSEPAPFRAMPLVWERAFGGPEFPLNPAGTGLDKGNKTGNILPNLEDPAHLLLSFDDRPNPACPFPISMDNPVRRSLSGTYNQHWQDTRWPAYPDDCSPEFFLSAQPDQRLRLGGDPFFRGDEVVEIVGMHHRFPHIRSRLPEARLRAFVLTTEQFVPFAENQDKGKKPRLPYAKDLDEPGLFREVELHCDTVWLFPDLLGAFVLYRGLLPVEDDEMDDVLRVLVVTEKPSEAPNPLEYYRDELQKRAYPAVEIDLAPFEAAQARISKAVKAARDVPKTLNKVKKNVLGQSPVMPLSLGDIAHSAEKTISTGRNVLDQLEKQMLVQREQFSHLISFDLSIFPKMRAMLDEQEANLKKTLSQVQADVDLADRRLKQGVASVKANAKTALEPPPDATPEELAQKTAMRAEVEAKLEKLDDFSPEGVLRTPLQLNPWHDRGFPLVIAARRSLQRDDAVLGQLVNVGFDPVTLENAWIGYSANGSEEFPGDWGLPADQDAPEYILPAGLYVPRFEGRELVALRVYPCSDIETLRLRGLGADAAAMFVVPGSVENVLSLPASYPGGAVVVVPEDLSALFAEQEVGDFCHIVAAPGPADLGAVEDLPPLQPDVPAEEGGLPLLVILPPLPEGKGLGASWLQACPGAIPLYLPEDCPHVLALAEHGHRLRRLVLDVLPPELAKTHDFDFPLPPKNKPPEPFSLNLPLPDKEELQGRIEGLIKDIRAHFPDPQQMLREMLAQNKPVILANLAQMDLPPGMLEKVQAALEQPISPPAKEPTVAEMFSRVRAELKGVEGRIPDNTPPQMRAQILDALGQAEKDLNRLEGELTPLESLRAEGEAKLEAFKKGELPDEVKAAFAEKGMDPNALKPLTREEVEAILAGDRNLERRNLQGLDLSGLDFSGARLAHALCGKTSFQGCLMTGADFTFTIANEADFTGANLQGAKFKQTVLQKAVLRQADFSNARMELTTLGECDCTSTVFDGVEMKLCNFTKAVLVGASFLEASLSLCALSQIEADNADFDRLRAFKCLFQKADLKNTTFRKSTLNECLFQNTKAVGISLVGADLRKFYTDAGTDLSEADFSGVNLQEASFRMSYFQGADFYNANLENAFVLQCDLSNARLDGVQAAGCRFIKCDLSGADISGAKLLNGALRKCRLNSADLVGANLYAANLQGVILNHETRIEGVNLKRTLLDGKEEALKDAFRNS